MKLIWNIREATPVDTVGLKMCMESAYASYQERMGGVRLPPMDVDYLSEINNYPTWVVEIENRILGGLIMVFEKDQASIANVAISPMLQGQGIGGVLIRFAESKAKQKGYSALHLTTHVLLAENISLYRHLGWQESARDQSRVFMLKHI